MTDSAIENISFSDIVKKMKQIEEENQRLQYTKKRYAELSEKVCKIATVLSEQQELLNNIAQELDPVVKIGVRSGTDYAAAAARNKQIFLELSEKLTQGTHITTKFIQQLYPELQTYAIQNLMVRLTDLPGVQRVKEGRNVRLFV